MPLSAGLQRAVEAVSIPGLGAALEVIGVTELLPLLSSRASFMAAPALDDVQLAQLRDDLRRVRDESDPPDRPCGGLAALPGDAAALSHLRILIYAARREFKLEEQLLLASAPNNPGTPAPVPAPAPADEVKPLPAKDITALYESAERCSGGCMWVPPKYRLSDSLVSKLARANANGHLFVPAVDSGFAYADPSSTRSVTTLLKAGGDGSSLPDISLQMVQGSQLVERRDPVTLVADYLDIISHRTAALVACYGTPEAAAKFSASDRYGNMDKHKLSLPFGAARPLLLPRMACGLERALREAARQGHSTAAMLAIDRAVVDAIHERHSEIAEDGNLAIEFVCNQRSTLFRPAAPVSLGDIAAGTFGRDGLESSVGPSVSAAGSFSSGNQRRLQSEQEKKLQSERDRLRSELEAVKRQRLHAVPDSRSGGAGTGERSVFGGNSRRMGGGDPRASQICRDFNAPNGCQRSACKFKHACDRTRADGRVCGDGRHCAVHH